MKDDIELKVGNKVINTRGVIGTIIRENENFLTISYKVDAIIGGHVVVKTMVTKVSMTNLLDRGILIKLLPFEEIEDFDPGHMFTNNARITSVILDVDNTDDTYTIESKLYGNLVQRKITKHMLHTYVSKGIWWRIRHEEVIR